MFDTFTRIADKEETLGKGEKESICNELVN
jgi:hypothetical protein